MHTPGKRSELTGQRFGRLVVQELAGSTKKYGGSELTWRCKCDCGKETTVPTRHLTSGNTQSCGCTRTDAMARVNILGQKLGDVTVIWNMRGAGGKWGGLWWCICDCGTGFEARGRDLRDERVTCCPACTDKKLSK